MKPEVNKRKAAKSTKMWKLNWFPGKPVDQRKN